MNPNQAASRLLVGLLVPVLMHVAGCTNMGDVLAYRTPEERERITQQARIFDRYGPPQVKESRGGAMLSFWPPDSPSPLDAYRGYGPSSQPEQWHYTAVGLSVSFAPGQAEQTRELTEDDRARITRWLGMTQHDIVRQLGPPVLIGEGVSDGGFRTYRPQETDWLESAPDMRVLGYPEQGVRFIFLESRLFIVGPCDGASWANLPQDYDHTTPGFRCGGVR